MLPDCGNITLSKHHCPAYDDWAERETTQDQSEIEAELSKLLKDLGKSATSKLELLHVGIGNSKLALKFCKCVRNITGITVMPTELRLGESSSLPNYEIIQCNKYGDEFARLIQDKFDIIIDNNPTSYSCCHTHYLKYLSRLYQYLKPEGTFFSHRLGVSYIVDVGPVYPVSTFVTEASMLNFNVSFSNDVILLRK